MRAAILREYGATPEPGEFEEPSGGEGREVVEVLAAGLNPVDIAKASGSFYAGSPPLPSVAASEGVGRLPDGRTVYFGGCAAPYGSLAERTLVEREGVFAVPEEVDPALAVCFGVAGTAGWLAVQWRARLAEGETVLVLGASGTVGQVAVQAARLLGAGRVVAAGRSAEGLKRAAELASAAVRGRPVSILGYTSFAVPLEVRRAAYERMVAHAAAGELTADFERVPLDRAAEAWERQRSGPGTKLVVVP